MAREIAVSVGWEPLVRAIGGALVYVIPAERLSWVRRAPVHMMAGLVLAGLPCAYWLGLNAESVRMALRLVLLLWFGGGVFLLACVGRMEFHSFARDRGEVLFLHEWTLFFLFLIAAALAIGGLHG